METFGHFFSSLLNMLGFTSEPSTDSLKKSDSKSTNSTSSLKEDDQPKESNETKKEESEETFTFIDVFEKDKDKEEIEEMVHEIFITNF